MPSRRTFAARIAAGTYNVGTSRPASSVLTAEDFAALLLSLPQATSVVATDYLPTMTTAGVPTLSTALMARTYVLGIAASVADIPESTVFGSSVGIGRAIDSAVRLSVLDSFGVAPSGVGYPQVLALGLPARFYAIDNNVGTPRWGFVFVRAGNHQYGGDLAFYKTRSADGTTRTAVANGDTIGELTWQGVTADGGTVRAGAGIVGIVNGAVSSGVLPIDLLFGTNPSADVINNVNARWRLTSAGHWNPEATNAYTVSTAAPVLSA